MPTHSFIYEIILQATAHARSVRESQTGQKCKRAGQV